MKINTKDMIITIDTELASNGEKIAKELSFILGIPCYGTEILDRASEISGIPYKLLHKYDGRAVHSAYDLTAADTDEIRIAPAADFITAQVFAARSLAQGGSCILVDRHANAALEGRKNKFSVFIHADFNDRAGNIAAEKGMSLEAAQKYLKKADRAYRNYYKGNNKGWGDAENYDLCVNASDADELKIADMIASFLELLTDADIRAIHQIKIG